MLAKTSSQGTLELALHDRHDLALGERRHLVLKRRRARARTSGREEVRSGREDLAEFGECRPEFLERASKTLRARMSSAESPPGLSRLPNPYLASTVVMRAARPKNWPRSARRRRPRALPGRGRRVRRRRDRVHDDDRARRGVRNAVGNASRAGTRCGRSCSTLPTTTMSARSSAQPRARSRRRVGSRTRAALGRGARHSAGQQGQCIAAAAFAVADGADEVLGSDDLEYEQLGAVALGHLRGPLDRSAGGVGPVGGDQDPLYQPVPLLTRGRAQLYARASFVSVGSVPTGVRMRQHATPLRAAASVSDVGGRGVAAAGGHRPPQPERRAAPGRVHAPAGPVVRGARGQGVRRASRSAGGSSRSSGCASSRYVVRREFENGAR